MPVSVKVNGAANSLVHKGSNAVSAATLPDVCKTPSPGGPVPLPYPNVSQSATLDKGSKTVKADGGMMIAVKGSEFSLSNGDQPGTAGGVKSSTFMKESSWILYSFDVRIEGKNACRLSDKKFQNHQNSADLAGAIQTPVAVAPVDAGTEEPKCECCGKAAHSAMQARGEEISETEFYSPTPPRGESVPHFAREAAEVLKRIRSGPCKNLLPPAKPKPATRCNQYFLTSAGEKRTIENAWNAYRDVYYRKMKVPKSQAVGHRVPKAAGGCPTGPGNLTPVPAGCDEEEAKLSELQGKAITWHRRVRGIT